MVEIYGLISVVSEKLNYISTNPTNDNADSFFDIYKIIITILQAWVGDTYIGIQKDKDQRDFFQKFFVALYKFLLVGTSIHCSNSENTKALNDFCVKALYRGRLYRYLGHGSLKKRKVAIEPKYNEYYVSWSKNPYNSYIESKLYGSITKLTCEVIEPYFGIDLCTFGVSRGNEAEVVFPTISETIVDIEKVKR